MNRDELTMEECKATWREEAGERAKQDVKDAGLHGAEAEALFEERKAHHYAELENI
jgi:hypothetical protein